MQRRYLYTIVTIKAAKGRKGTLVAMIKGTRAEDITAALERIPEKTGERVQEVTMDMAGNMSKAIRSCFPKALAVINRFHVQKMAYNAVQELRIKYGWEAIEAENTRMDNAKKNKQVYEVQILGNWDTLIQLHIGSRYLLFDQALKWRETQKEWAKVLLDRHPLLKTR